MAAQPTFDEKNSQEFFDSAEKNMKCGGDPGSNPGQGVGFLF